MPYRGFESHLLRQIRRPAAIEKIVQAVLPGPSTGRCLDAQQVPHTLGALASALHDFLQPVRRRIETSSPCEQLVVVGAEVLKLQLGTWLSSAMVLMPSSKPLEDRELQSARL